MDAADFVCFWTDISGNIGPESSISESKVQAQGPAIPECHLSRTVHEMTMGEFREIYVRVPLQFLQVFLLLSLLFNIYRSLADKIPGHPQDHVLKH